MKLRYVVGSLVLLQALAAGTEVRAQEATKHAQPAPGILSSYLNRPFLQVIRAYGKPSSVKTVQLKAVAPNVKDAEGIVWVYDRPEVVLEFLIGEDGKVLQAAARSRTLQQYRVEP